ncbi:hypothetical protein D3C87_2039600 [compost metagenome]
MMIQRVQDSCIVSVALLWHTNNCATAKNDIQLPNERKGEQREVMPQPAGFNPSLGAYIEVISYQQLLEDAKRRNRVLFDKLYLTV